MPVFIWRGRAADGGVRQLGVDSSALDAGPTAARDSSFRFGFGFACIIAVRDF
jgi:hypothetical protein